MAARSPRSWRHRPEPTCLSRLDRRDRRRRGRPDFKSRGHRREKQTRREVEGVGGFRTVGLLRWLTRLQGFVSWPELAAAPLPVACVRPWPPPSGARVSISPSDSAPDPLMSGALWRPHHACGSVCIGRSWGFALPEPGIPRRFLSLPRTVAPSMDRRWGCRASGVSGDLLVSYLRC
jgi:hypothetical protein